MDDISENRRIPQDQHVNIKFVRTDSQSKEEKLLKFWKWLDQMPHIEPFIPGRSAAVNNGDSSATVSQSSKSLSYSEQKLDDNTLVNLELLKIQIAIGEQCGNSWSFETERDNRRESCFSGEEDVPGLARNIIDAQIGKKRNPEFRISEQFPPGHERIEETAIDNCKMYNCACEGICR